jgi:type IV pilus assembly protein PilX
MISFAYRTRSAQRGVVLISSLLLLIVVTIIALSLFRSFGVQEKIAGNMREKQRALQAAESAETFAEIWLSNNGNVPSTPCSLTLNANIGQGQICANQLQFIPGVDITNPPYKVGGVPVGVSYTPSGAQNMVIGTSSVASLSNPTYFGTPTFYISDMGPSADPTIPGEIYQVDAYGYGGSGTTVAVVESTYAVYTSSSNRTL